MWKGDSSDNPNNQNKSHFRLSSFDYYIRFEEKERWVKVNLGTFIRIKEFAHLYTKQEIKSEYEF